MDYNTPMAIATIGSLKLDDPSNLTDPKRLRQRWFTQNKMTVFMSMPCFVGAMGLGFYGMTDPKVWFLSVVAAVLGGYFLVEAFSTPLWKLIRRKKELKQIDGKLIGFSRLKESPRMVVNALFVFDPLGAAQTQFSEVYSWQGFPRGNEGQGGRFIDPVVVQILYDPDDVKCAAVAGISSDELTKISDANLKPLDNHSAA